MRHRSPSHAVWAPILTLTLHLAIAGTVLAEPFAYISNGFEDTLSVIDTTTDEVVATVQLSGFPFGVVVSPDGERAYVANYFAIGAAESLVSVIDARTATEIATIPVGLQPRGIAISADGKTLFVANATSGAVSIVDTEALVETVRVPTGAGATVAIPSPDGSAVYVTNQNEDTISRIDLSDLSVLTVPSGDQPSGLAVHPSGDFVYVAAEKDDAIEVVDPDTLAVVARIPVPLPELVVFHPSGKAAYVTSPDPGLLTVVDTSVHEVTVQVPVGVGTEGISFHPDGDRLYLVNFRNDEVLVFRLDSMSVETSIPTGEFPVALGDFIGPLPVGGSVDGVVPNVVLCRNLTTGQTVPLPQSGDDWDCEAAGLEVEPDDVIRIEVQGKAN